MEYQLHYYSHAYSKYSVHKHVSFFKTSFYLTNIMEIQVEDNNNLEIVQDNQSQT